MTVAERRSLLDRRDGYRFLPLARRVAYSTICLCSGILLSLMGHSLLNSEEKNHSLAVEVASALLALVAAFCVTRLFMIWFDSFSDLGFSLHHEKKNVPTINSALADGRVIVTRIQSQKVAEIPDCEDASAYVFDIGVNRSFVMKNEDYSPESIANPWPNSDFELVRTHSGNLTLGVNCYGTSLQPEFVIEVCNRRFEILLEIQEGVIEFDFESYLASLVAGSVCT